MSRLASKPIVLNAGITCALEGSNIKITKANKTSVFPINTQYVEAKIEGNSVLFSANKAVKTPASLRGLLGTTWALFKGAVKDFEFGAKAKLAFFGVGYKPAVVKAGNFNYLKIIVGFSHPIFIFIPKGLTVTLEGATTAIVSGEKIGDVMAFCAKVRSQKKPSAYKGTGVIMNDEVVIKKAGKKK